MILRAAGLIIGLVALRVLMGEAFNALENSLVQIFNGIGTVATYADPQYLQNFQTAGFIPPISGY